MVYLVVLASVLRATTKKGRQLLAEKCTPEKIPTTPNAYIINLHAKKQA